MNILIVDDERNILRDFISEAEQIDQVESIDFIEANQKSNEKEVNLDVKNNETVLLEQSGFVMLQDIIYYSSKV